MPPTTMRALITDGSASATVSSSVEVPTPSAGEILVKVTYIAQNPTDWKGMKSGGPAGLVIGCDFAGVVASSNGSHWKDGQRVAGFVFGKTPRRGAFAEYLVTEASQVYEIPDGTTDQQAAVVPLAYATAAQALVQRLGLPEMSKPAKTVEYVLVNGGASSVGMYAVQMAKKAGLFVVATASKRNEGLVKGLGADEVVDYTQEKWWERVKEATKGRVRYALDCVSERETMVGCAKSLDGGKVVTILPRKKSELEGVEGVKGVEVESTIVYTVFGREVPEGYKIFDNSGRETLSGDKAFWEKQLSFLPGYLKDGTIKPNQVKERGGLEDLMEGFKEQQEGKVRAEKLVYKV